MYIAPLHFHKGLKCKIKSHYKFQASKCCPSLVPRPSAPCPVGGAEAVVAEQKYDGGGAGVRSCKAANYVCVQKPKIGGAKAPLAPPPSSVTLVQRVWGQD